MRAVIASVKSDTHARTYPLTLISVYKYSKVI